jgi:hypothetical protein
MGHIVNRVKIIYPDMAHGLLYKIGKEEWKMSGKRLEGYVILVFGTIWEVAIMYAMATGSPFLLLFWSAMSLIALTIVEGISLYNWVLDDAD